MMEFERISRQDFVMLDSADLAHSMRGLLMTTVLSANCRVFTGSKDDDMVADDFGVQPCLH
jgi:hypothetical protein